MSTIGSKDDKKRDILSSQFNCDPEHELAHVVQQGNASSHAEAPGDWMSPSEANGFALEYISRRTR
jgi:hypothetical protein